MCVPGAPLFDSSSNFTDPQTLQLLQHSQRLLGNLSAIFHCLLSEAQELTQRGALRPYICTAYPHPNTPQRLESGWYSRPVNIV